MNITETKEWNGYKQIFFEFEGKTATVVFASNPTKENKWMLKTEYFGAFPDFEIEMLKRGYHLAHVDNETRWCKDSDTLRQAKFCDYLHTELGFCEKCFPVGMSCGGMQAIYLAGKYPEKVAAMFLDAPVVNLLSCPFGVGRENADKWLPQEFKNHMGLTLSDMLSFREHPLDYIPKAVSVPTYLCCGDSDTIVPYEENGKLLYDYFTSHGGKVVLSIKKGGDHHPHGLPDNAPIIEFALNNY